MANFFVKDKQYVLEQLKTSISCMKHDWQLFKYASNSYRAKEFLLSQLAVADKLNHILIEWPKIQ